MLVMDLRCLLLYKENGRANDLVRLLLEYKDEAISGEALIALQHSDLKEMGMGSVGHRLKVLKSVYEVKTKQSISVEADHYIPLCKWRFSSTSGHYMISLA